MADEDIEGEENTEEVRAASNKVSRDIASYSLFIWYLPRLGHHRQMLLETATLGSHRVAGTEVVLPTAAASSWRLCLHLHV